MKSRRVLTGLTGLACLAALAAATPVRAALTTDVIFVVDESGSMAGEHAWITTMVSSLETDLIAAGVTGNRYGLVGFGSSAGHGTIAGHKHSVGGGDFGTAAQLSTAAGGLVTSGATEDGWAAVLFALNNYSFRSDAAVNIVLITDEDRDNVDGSATQAGVASALAGKNAILNAVVNNPFGSDSGAALGRTTTDAYLANGSGGFTTATGPTTGDGFGSTETQYVPLALNSKGAAWDLNFLRAGGSTADSFSAAFVKIKVGEIVIQPGSGVPEPASASCTVSLGSVEIESPSWSIGMTADSITAGPRSTGRSDSPRRPSSRTIRSLRSARSPCNVHSFSADVVRPPDRCWTSPSACTAVRSDCHTTRVTTGSWASFGISCQVDRLVGPNSADSIP